MFPLLFYFLNKQCPLYVGNIKRRINKQWPNNSKIIHQTLNFKNIYIFTRFLHNFLEHFEHENKNNLNIKYYNTLSALHNAIGPINNRDV